MVFNFTHKVALRIFDLTAGQSCQKKKKKQHCQVYIRLMPSQCNQTWKEFDHIPDCRCEFQTGLYFQLKIFHSFISVFPAAPSEQTGVGPSNIKHAKLAALVRADVQQVSALRFDNSRRTFTFSPAPSGSSHVKAGFTACETEQAK